MTGNTSAIRAGAAFVEILTDQTKLDRGLQIAGRKLSAWGRAASQIGQQAMKAGLAIQAPLLASAKIYASLGAEMARGAQRANLSVESFSALKYAADQNGVSVESLEKAVDRMSRKLGQAGQGNRQATGTFARLGLSIGDLLKMSPDQKIGAIADALGKIKSPDVRNALAEDIFGRDFSELVPLLRLGSAGMAAVIARARELGAVMSNQDATAALQFDQKLRDLWTTVQFGAFRIGGELAPALEDAIQKLIRATKTTSQFVHDHQQLVTTVLKGAIGLTALGLSASVLGKVFSGLSFGISVLRFGLQGFTALSAIVTPGGAIVLGFVALGAAIAYVTYKLGLLNGLMRELSNLNKNSGNSAWAKNLFSGVGSGSGSSSTGEPSLWDRYINSNIRAATPQRQMMYGPLPRQAAGSSNGPSSAEIYRQAAQNRLPSEWEQYNQLIAQDMGQTVTGDALPSVKAAAVARRKRIDSLQKQIDQHEDIAEFGSVEKGRVEREKYNDAEGTRKWLARDRAETLDPLAKHVEDVKKAVSPTGFRTPHGDALIAQAQTQYDQAKKAQDIWEQQQLALLKSRNAQKDIYAQPRIKAEIDRATGTPHSWQTHSIAEEVRQANAAKAAAENKSQSAWSTDFANSAALGMASMGAFNKADFNLGAPVGGAKADGVEKNTGDMVKLLGDIKKNTAPGPGDGSGIRLN